MKHLQVNAIWIVPILYSLIAIVGPKLNIKGEVFPFFNWGLYSQVPQKIVVNEMYLVNAKGVEINLHETISTKVSKVTYYNILDGFVHNLGKQKEVRYLNQILAYIPKNSKIIVKQIEKRQTTVIGEIINNVFNPLSIK